MLYLGKPLDKLPPNFTGIGVFNSLGTYDYFEAKQPVFDFDSYSQCNLLDPRKRYDKIAHELGRYLSAKIPAFQLYKNGELVNELTFSRYGDRMMANKITKRRVLSALLHYMISYIGVYDNIDYIGTYNRNKFYKDDILSDASLFTTRSSKNIKNVTFFAGTLTKGYVIENVDSTHVISDNNELYEFKYNYDADIYTESTLLIEPQELKKLVIKKHLAKVKGE